jgi:lipoyl(octanoyl) transferase
MKETILKAIRPSDYALNDSNFSLIDERSVIVTKWNWDYSLGHKFQRRALEVVQETPNLRILICCSHPEILTNGRGLQKPRKGEVLNLVEFNPKDHKELPYPLYQIERGGGLTFHHPGQFIFYPIVKLNPATLSLSRMIDQIFDFTIDVLNSWGAENLHHENKLLGLWHAERKVASMGIAIEKLTTFHGMALNLIENKNMFEALSELNPCGLTRETYTSIEALMKLPENPLETFKEQFLKRIQDEWK